MTHRTLALAAVLLSGCGGRAVADAPGMASADASDAARADAAVVQDAGPGPEASVIDAKPDGPPSTEDAAPGEFCEGSAKASWQGTLVDPVAVTTGLVVMDCCEGFTVRWHTDGVFGYSPVFALRVAATLPIGDYELAGGIGESVSLSKAGEPEGFEQQLEGTLSVQQPGGPNEPSRVSLCVTVVGAGDPLQGLRLHVADVPLASWTQQDDWTLHLLADEHVTAVEAATMPLDGLALDPPLLTLMQVAYYDASAHTVVWDSWGSTGYLVNQLPNVGVGGVPFVVRARGQSVFLGAVMTSLSSMSFHGPTVTLEQVVDDRLVLEPGYPSGPAPDPDPRDDPRIIGVFEAAGKLVP